MMPETKMRISGRTRLIYPQRELARAQRAVRMDQIDRTVRLGLKVLMAFGIAAFWFWVMFRD